MIYNKYEKYNYFRKHIKFIILKYLKSIKASIGLTAIIVFAISQFVLEFNNIKVIIS